MKTLSLILTIALASMMFSCGGNAGKKATEKAEGEATEMVEGCCKEEGECAADCKEECCKEGECAEKCAEGECEKKCAEGEEAAPAPEA